MNTLFVALGFLFSLSLVASILVISALVVSSRTSPEVEEFEMGPTIIDGAPATTKKDRLPGGALARSTSSRGEMEPAPDSLTRSRARATMETA